MTAAIFAADAASLAATPRGWILLGASYVLGSINVSYWVVRLVKGLDVRTLGSGNAGATNVLRAAGKRAGAVALLGDLSKGVIPVLAARLLDVDEPWPALAALVAVLGHVFPVFLGFRGGKGVATAAGAFVALAPWAALFAALSFFVLVATFRYVSLGSIAAAALFPVFDWGLGRAGTHAAPSAGTLAAITAVSALILWKHRANFVRLMAGTERRLGGQETPVELVREAIREPAGRAEGGQAAGGVGGLGGSSMASGSMARGGAGVTASAAQDGDARAGETETETEAEEDGRPIGVLGAGSWGSALAIAEASAGRRVRLWARRPEVVAALRGERRSAAVGGVALPPTIEPTADLAALADCDPILIVVASQGVRDTVRALLPSLPDGVTLVSASKGVETETLERMSEVVREEADRAGRRVRFAVLSGPTFADEVARSAPSAAVVASDEPGTAAWVQGRLSTRTLRLYTSADLVGVELAGTAKNVIAIAAGVVTGLGLGHNTLAALITRGLHEITRLGVASGGDPRTFAGLAGLGDLVLTCTGGLSRNRRVGLALAAGKTLEQALGEMEQIAEGVRNSATVAGLAREQGVEMPIIEQMQEVLHHGKSPRRAVEELMRRELKEESAL